jgi:hypothetical protein
MANTSGRVRYKLFLQFLETITPTEHSLHHSPIYETTSSEVGQINNTNYFKSIEDIDYQDEGNENDGYLDGQPFYVQAESDSCTAPFDAGGLEGPIQNVKFLYIENTGYEYLSSSGLGDANTDDYLCIRASASDGLVLAMLGAGECFALPIRDDGAWTSSETASNDFYLQAVDPDDADAEGTNVSGLSVRFICV